MEDIVLQWPDATLAVHCFNEMWRRAGLNKSARYGARSPYELLKARYLCAAGDAEIQGEIPPAPTDEHSGA